MKPTDFHALWTTSTAAWLAWLIAGAISDETVKLRTYQLRRFARDFRARSPWDLQPDDLAVWMAGHQWSTESRRSYRAALRSYFGWAHASGFITADPARLLRKITPPPPVPRPASEPTIEAALQGADTRTWLMLMLGSRQGMRRAEIAKVHSRDISWDEAGWWIMVHGKGGKDRRIPLLGEIGRALVQRPAGWVFPNGQGGHISPAWCGKLTSRALADATTHQLRHRFATRTYRATHDIRAVQELLGHASVATTQRYTAVDGEAMRTAVESAA